MEELRKRLHELECRTEAIVNSELCAYGFTDRAYELFAFYLMGDDSEATKDGMRRWVAEYTSNSRVREKLL